MSSNSVGLLVHVRETIEKKGGFGTIQEELGAKKTNVNRQESVMCRWQGELPILELPPLFFRHVPHNLEGIYYSQEGKRLGQNHLVSWLIVDFSPSDKESERQTCCCCAHQRPR